MSEEKHGMKTEKVNDTNWTTRSTVYMLPSTYGLGIRPFGRLR